MSQLSHHPDLILHNGRIYTVDQARPWAQALAIRKHRIVAIGGAELLALAGAHTRIMDLAGKLVLPGLCDAHIHMFGWSLGVLTVQLADCTSKAAMLQRIAERAAITPPGGWVTGGGWNESRWGETAFPTADDLDPITGPDRPALFSRSDGHGAVVNRAALRLAGISAATPNPAGGVIDKDAHGQPTGVLRELAIDLVARHIPPADQATIDNTLIKGMSTLHRLGITAIHDQRVKDGDDGPQALAAYQRLRRAHRLQLRVNCNIAAHNLPELAALGLQSGFGDDYLRLGHVKVFSDGSLGSRTAWMLAPFVKVQPAEEENFGLVLTPSEQMAREFRQATELGFPISVHAIGDQANRVVLDIFEELADSGLRPAIPHRIEHAQTLDPVDLSRFAQLQVTASVQPIHVTDDMETADLLLGPRGARMYNFRSLLESGALLAFGSDAPVADANPFLGIHAALYRQRPEWMVQGPWYGNECISLEATLHAYTLGAAQSAGWAQTIGSLTPGKRADLIVLDRDLFALVARGVMGAELAGAQVQMTIFDGEIVFHRE
jgi:hypothetical protein